MPLRVKNAILCDLVRVEDNGKHLLIGVYVGSVAFEKFPSVFAPMFWIQFETTKPDEEVHLEIKVDVPLSAELAKAELHARSGAEREGTLVIGGTPMQIAGPGRLVLSARRKGERWLRILTKSLQLRGSPLPSP